MDWALKKYIYDTHLSASVPYASYALRTEQRPLITQFLALCDA